MKKISLSIIIVSIFFSLFGCKPNQKKINITGEAQGTYYSITYFDSDGRDFQVQVDSLLRIIDLSVSLWVDESVLSRVNRGDSTVVLDKIFTDNFALSQQMGDLSDGYFDFTIGPLVGAWGFHRKNKMDLNQAKIDSLKQLVNFRNVSLVNGKVFRADSRMSFDFNAIAQGYSVDLLAAFFDDKGVNSYVIDLGGEIFARNRKTDGTMWKVGIESPASSKDDERTLQVVVKLENKGLATSGSYRKYFEKDGHRYSHAIDPKTGYPVDHHVLSVTVLAESAAKADALATAFMVMGLEKSIQMLEKTSEVDAYFIFWNNDKTFGTYATKGMEAIIEK